MFRLSRRDALLILLGASSMHIWSLLLHGLSPETTEDYTPITLTQLNQQVNHVVDTATKTTTATVRTTVTATTTRTTVQTQAVESSEGWSYEDVDKLSGDLSPRDELLPPTTLISHAPGWTLFRNLYMYNDTIYIVTDDVPVTPSLRDPENSRDRKPDYYGPHGEDLTYGYTKAGDWPEIRKMTSTGGSAVNSPENIAEREPRPQHMQFISTKEAKRRWGDIDEHGKPRTQSTVMVVKGNSLLFNDPSQFLRHYYHFVAELFFGVQAFWNSVFNPTLTQKEVNLAAHFGTSQEVTPPPIHRAIFIHSNADGWRDNPGFNRYFLRAAYPSLTVEHEEDWQDRVKTSIEGVATGSSPQRVWRFPMALLTDRSASHRGVICGSQTQRRGVEHPTPRHNGVSTRSWAGRRWGTLLLFGQALTLALLATLRLRPQSPPWRKKLDLQYAIAVFD
ncbi:hypothetical protein NMY22_g17008 [Coprinellus aureogranulatus]|nr:hypothetical protein NMY22_g17008 [Coprinellus aureogranulatus]